MEVVSTVQPYEGEPHASNEDMISTKTDHDGFSPAVFRSRLEKKFPLLNV